MKKKKGKKKNYRFVLPFIFYALMFFVIGMFYGLMIGEQKMIRNTLEVLEGLEGVFEGANIEMNIDINETIIVDRTLDKMKEFGVFNLTQEVIE